MSKSPYTITKFDNEFAYPLVEAVRLKISKLDLTKKGIRQCHKELAIQARARMRKILLSEANSRRKLTREEPMRQMGDLRQIEPHSLGKLRWKVIFSASD
jgi:hypothetical protein